MIAPRRCLPRCTPSWPRWNGKRPLPWDMFNSFNDGGRERVHLTPAAWQATGRRTAVRIAGAKALRAVTLDTGIFVDANPAHNAWQAEAIARR